jgi:hypothetical protein
LHRGLKNYIACIFSERTALNVSLLEHFQESYILRQKKIVIGYWLLRPWCHPAQARAFDGRDAGST